MRAAPLLTALLLAACAGPGAPARPGVAWRSLTPEFQAARSVLARGDGMRARGDARALRAHGPETVEAGVALIRSTLPHDLGRARVPLYLEGRAEFGERLKAFAAALEAPADDRLLLAHADLSAAFHGWVAAYRGLPPERSL